MSDDEERIISAIEKSNFKWRTVEGIVKDSRLPIKTVEETMDNSEKILRSSKTNKEGHSLYTTRDKYRDVTPLRRRFISAITNKV